MFFAIARLAQAWHIHTRSENLQVQINNTRGRSTERLILVRGVIIGSGARWRPSPPVIQESAVLIRGEHLKEHWRDHH